jgi:predicted metalloprotease with PDZ domain
VRNNSPAEEAGLQADDTIVSIGGNAVSHNTWSTTLKRYKPGDRLTLTVKRDRQTIQTNLVLGAPERFEYRIEEKKDATVEEKQLRAAWLKGN